MCVGVVLKMRAAKRAEQAKMVSGTQTRAGRSRKQQLTADHAMLTGSGLRSQYDEKADFRWEDPKGALVNFSKTFGVPEKRLES